jgi:hypothetical protein
MKCEPKNPTSLYRNINQYFTIKNTVPTFVVDAMQPNYLISQSPDKVVLRNFDGVITTYPEPYTAFQIVLYTL